MITELLADGGDGQAKPSVREDPPSIVVHFGSLEDPRQEAKCEHLLVDILVMALIATICRAQGWAEIADSAESKEALLRTFLELPSGIPSVHTFQRVISGVLAIEKDRSTKNTWFWLERVGPASHHLVFRPGMSGSVGGSHEHKSNGPTRRPQGQSSMRTTPLVPYQGVYPCARWSVRSSQTSVYFER